MSLSIVPEANGRVAEAYVGLSQDVTAGVIPGSTCIATAYTSFPAARVSAWRRLDHLRRKRLAGIWAEYAAAVSHAGVAADEAGDDRGQPILGDV